MLRPKKRWGQNFLNDPNSVNSYLGDTYVTGWKNGAPVAGWETKTLAQKKEASADWLSVSGSGFNIRNDSR